MIFHSHEQIKLIFTWKVVHLASFWKWGFLELGSGLFIVYLYAGINDDFFSGSTTLYSVGHYMSIPYVVSMVQGLSFWHGKKFKWRFSTTVGACVGNLLPIITWTNLYLRLCSVTLLILDSVSCCHEKLSDRVWTPTGYVTLLFRERRSFAPLQKAHRNHRS